MATRAPRRPAKEAVGSIAPMMVGTFNLFIIEAMGEQCGITEMEAKFLIPSLQRTLERMPAGAATKASVILDPLIIVAVVGMWMKRIGDIKRQEVLQRAVIGPQERARANGISGTEYRVPDNVQMPPTDAQIADEVAWHAAQQQTADNGFVVIPPDAGVPVPDKPDMTANAVPAVIRESLNGTSFDSAL